MWNLKNGINQPIYRNRNSLTDTQNELMVAKGEGVGGRLGLVDLRDVSSFTWRG